MIVPSDITGADTIAAIATAPGRAALATLRISGPTAVEIAKSILVPRIEAERRSTHTRVVNSDGSAIDDVVATLFRAPRSSTGEDVLEISCHGGWTAPALILACVLGAGARQALPGEFTRRAVLNGKLDLVQAEAVGDLIEARSQAAFQVARRQLDGGLSARLEALRADVLHLEALLAYDIDFPEEDDGPVAHAHVTEAALDILGALEALLATSGQGALVHDGALIVITGPPNADKSSLFNALLGEARAIVTEIPGTTRDAIEAVVDRPGWPLRLVDTAGIRATSDPIEKLGVEATRRYLERADVVVHCVDGSRDTPVSVEATPPDVPVIRVRTKADLATEHDADGDMPVSAFTGYGLMALLDAISTRLSEVRGSPALDAPILTRARHQFAVREAIQEISAFEAAWRAHALPAPVAAVHIRAAADALGELIGSVGTDDVLDAVFSSFCVGK